MESLEEDLTVVKKRIKDLEMQIAIMLSNLEEISENIRDTHRYLAKLAHNQMELTKRVSQWPYIVVNNQEE